MSLKRKHTTLSVFEKAEIINKLATGQCAIQLARHYGVGKSTITDIKKNRDKILHFVSSANKEPKKRKTLRAAEHPGVESALYTWLLQERDRNAPMSGPILREKAKCLYEKFTGKTDFQASNGWLNKFKQRFGIRQLTVSGEKLSGDVSAVEPFQRQFLQKIQDLGLSPHQIYNAHESELFWKPVSNETLAHRNDDAAPGRKVSNERITFMPCCNSTGTHKLKLLVIGKAKKPRAFANCFDALPVVYKRQSRAWVTQQLFKEWFQEEFVPSIREKMRELNLQRKALLLLDNAPGHPSEQELISDDGKILAMFLPPNCAPLLQPMDQSVIQSIKLNYRKMLLLHMDTVAESLFNLNDVAFSLDEAWISVNVTLIQKSWKKLWPTQVQTFGSQPDEKDLIPFLPTTNCGQFDENVKAENELQIDEKDLIPFLPITNSEQFSDSFSVSITENELTGLPNKASQGKKLTVNQVEDCIIGCKRERHDDIAFTGEEDVLGQNNEAEEEERPTGLVKHSNAIASFKVCLQWASENEVPLHHIMLLRQLQEKAMMCDFKFNNP